MVGRGMVWPGWVWRGKAWYGTRFGMVWRDYTRDKKDYKEKMEWMLKKIPSTSVDCQQIPM